MNRVGIGGASNVGNTQGAGQARPTQQRQSHVQVLEQQIGKIDQQLKGAGWGANTRELRALRQDLASELGRVQQALAGNIRLPPQTQAAVDNVTRGLGAEEKAVVLAKAAELSDTGYGVEKTSGPRFAANLAMELSEYLAMGATPSSGLSAAMTKLVQDGMPVFSQNRQLMSDYQNNLATGRQNAAVRNGG